MVSIYVLPEPAAYLQMYRLISINYSISKHENVLLWYAMHGFVYWPKTKKEKKRSMAEKRATLVV